MDGKDQVYTIRELSDQLRVHPTTIYRLLRQGRLPAFRVGANWRFSQAAIEEWQSGQASKTAVPVARGKKRSTISLSDDTIR